jgi:hypothetical protein
MTTSFINMMADHDWSDADMDNRIRAVLASHVSIERQDELRTIMIGHIAGIRVATPKELGEVALVKTIAEEQGLQIIQARLDMALLRKAFAYEKAQARLALPELSEEDYIYTDRMRDAQERISAQAVLDAAEQEVLDLVAERAAFRAANNPA